MSTSALAPFTILALFFGLLGGGIAQSTSTAQSEDYEFTTIDVLVDPAGVELAAWQVELVDLAGEVLIVGVEGGEGTAYAEPPYHDPRALQTGRIRLAGFTLSDAAPRAKSRVARLHLAAPAGTLPEFQVRLEAAASPAGAIDGATVSLVR